MADFELIEYELSCCDGPLDYIKICRTIQHFVWIYELIFYYKLSQTLDYGEYTLEEAFFNQLEEERREKKREKRKKKKRKN